MLEFRKITTDEYNQIKEQLAKSLSLQDFEAAITPFEIILAVGKWKEVLLVTDQLLKTFQEFKDYRNPYVMGVHFGDLKGSKFRISLEGITLIAEYIEEKSILTNKGEKKVLYKRDLIKKDLYYIPAHAQRGDLSILTNKSNEVLALGKYLLSAKEIRNLEPNYKIIKNVIDKGWYLRKGK